MGPRRYPTSNRCTVPSDYTCLKGIPPGRLLCPWLSSCQAQGRSNHNDHCCADCCLSSLPPQRRQWEPVIMNLLGAIDASFLSVRRYTDVRQARQARPPLFGRDLMPSTLDRLIKDNNNRQINDEIVIPRLSTGPRIRFVGPSCAWCQCQCCIQVVSKGIFFRPSTYDNRFPSPPALPPSCCATQLRTSCHLSS